MAKHKHLTLQERYEIQHALNDGKTFKLIASKIGKDPSTISKEVRNRYIVTKSGGYGKPFNPCLHRKTCRRNDLCMDKACKLSRCASCNGCYTRCTDFVEEHCPKLDRPPYVLTACPFASTNNSTSLFGFSILSTSESLLVGFAFVAT